MGGVGIKKVGRPLGSVVTPRKLLEMEMREMAQLNRKIRVLLTEQLESIREELKENPSLTKRLDVVQALTSAVEKQGKGVDAAAKHLLGENEGAEEGIGVSGETLLGEIVGKRGG